MRRLLLLPITSLLLVLPTFAQDQYRAIILHPEGSPSTYAFASANGVQVGMQGVFGSYGLIWRGSPESVIHVRPTGAIGAHLHGTDGTRHAGTINFGNAVVRAALWNSDDPNDYVNLHPAGWHETLVHGMGGGEQVGVGYPTNFPNIFYALLWRGTAESMVNLNPQGAEYSIAEAAHSGTQVGHAQFPGISAAAALWRGTAESFVNLNPTGIGNAHALGVYGNQQVGWIRPPSQTNTRAALWYGTAASFVDLTPPGSLWAEAYGTNGQHQVGYFETAGRGHAGRWSGTVETLLDLHQFLPPEYASSFSRTEFIDESGIIVGWTRLPGTNHDRAVMWVPVPEPSTLGAVGFGLLALAFRKKRRATR